MKKHFKKRYVIGVLVCMLLIVTLVVLVGKPKSGSYILIANDSNRMMYRGIRLDMEAGTFELTGSPLDSQGAYTGTFVLEGNRLIASEHDSEATYVFDVVNGLAFKFNPQESAGRNQGAVKNTAFGADDAYYVYLNDFIGKMFYK